MGYRVLNDAANEPVRQEPCPPCGSPGQNCGDALRAKVGVRAGPNTTHLVLSRYGCRSLALASCYALRLRRRGSCEYLGRYCVDCQGPDGLKYPVDAGFRKLKPGQYVLELWEQMPKPKCPAPCTPKDPCRSCLRSRVGGVCEVPKDLGACAEILMIFDPSCPLHYLEVTAKNTEIIPCKPCPAPAPAAPVECQPSECQVC